MLIRTGAESMESPRGRGLPAHLLGERVHEPVDHPVIRPSIIRPSIIRPSSNAVGARRLAGVEDEST